MIFTFPTGTDAPIYHWPVATAAIIGINAVLGVFQVLAPDLTASLWQVSGTFTPHTWLTSNYIHGGLEHFFSNMMFLFILGIIVEGKIGWWRFALIYNGIAIASAILIDVVARAFGFPPTPGLGASCAIFGIMAISLLWAPENTIQFQVVGLLMFVRAINWSFEVPVQVLAGLYIVLNFAIALFTGFQESSELHHLMGVIPGLVVGWGMIRFRRVNCEGYDLFSILAGNRGSVVLTVQEEAEKRAQQRAAAKQRAVDIANSIAAMTKYANDGHYEMAFKKLQGIKTTENAIDRHHGMLVKIINGVEKQLDPQNRQQVEFRLKLLEFYLANYQKLQSQVALKIARHYLADNRPRQALKYIRASVADQLSDSGLALRQKCILAAQQQIAHGSIEIQPDR